MSGHGPRTSLLSGLFCINYVITMDTCQGTTEVLPLGPADLMDGFHEGLDIGLDRRALPSVRNYRSGTEFSARAAGSTTSSSSPARLLLT
jgi:hypothetical protein